MYSSEDSNLGRGGRGGRLLALLALVSIGLGGCGFLGRVFDPIDDDVGRIVTLEPKFPTLAVGGTVELRARIAGDPNDPASFEFSEDSGGVVVELFPLDGTRVLVTALAPGVATVFATADEDEGLAVVNVR